MIYKFTSRAKQAIECAQEEAISLGHNYVGSEHILYGLIKEINDSQIAKMYFYINPANLQLHFGQNLDSYDRDIKRAELIKQLIMNN